MSIVDSQSDSLGFNSTDEEFLSRMRRATAVDPGGRLGPYELLEEIGRGGQGVVYKARQPGTGRIIAIKRVTAATIGSTSFRVRFEREARSAAALHHPNIVTVYGCDQIDEAPLLLMEYVDGVPVDCWATQAIRDEAAGPTSSTGGDAGRYQGRSVPEILRLFEKICDAVRHAHQHGIIHRDLKPSNVLVDAGGEPHVLDFGLARVLNPTSDGTVLQTHTGGFVGTPAYASPEQLGSDDREVDVRSDVFSVGCMLYQSLTGRLPHAGGSSFAAVLKAIEHHDPRPPSVFRPGLNREIDAIVLKALAKSKDERYQSMDALSEDIRRYLVGRPVLAHLPTTWYQARKLIRRHKASFAVALVMSMLIVGFSAAAAVLAMRERAARVVGEWRTYTASLAAASAAIRADDCAGAQAYLKLAPEHLRNWEWRYFSAQADGSVKSRDTDCEVVAIDPQGSPILCAQGNALINSSSGDVLYARPGERLYATIFSRGNFTFSGFSQDLQYWFRCLDPNIGTSFAECIIDDVRTRQIVARSTLPVSQFKFARTTSDGRLALGSGGRELLIASLTALRTGGASAHASASASLGSDKLKWERIPLHDGIIATMVLSPDERRVATGAGDQCIQITDLPSRRIVRTIRTNERNLSALAFSPDGQRLASGSWDKRVTLWDLDTGKSIWAARAHRELVSALTFSGDGRLIASGSYDKSIHLHDASTGKTLTRLVGHRSELCGVAFLRDEEADGRATSRSDYRLSSFDFAGTLKTWRIRQEETSNVVRGEFRRIVAMTCSLDPAARWLAVLESVNENWRDPRISLVDLRERRKVGVLYVAHSDYHSDLYAINASRDGKWLAVGMAEGDVLLWAGQALDTMLASDDSASETRPPPPIRLKRVGDSPCPRVHQLIKGETLSSPACRVFSVAFGPHPGALEQLALTRFDGTVEIWDVHLRRPIFQKPSPPEGCARVCAFLPGPGPIPRLATVDSVGLVQILDSRDGCVLVERRTGLPVVSPYLHISPDGELMAYPTSDYQVALLRTNDLSASTLLHGHTQVVHGIAFSPDGSRLASAGADSTIRLWDVATGREAATLHGHEYAVYCLTFTDNGRTLVSGGGDNSIRFWHAPD